LDIINDVADDTTHMLLVGHNPAVSRIVAYLTQHSLENIPPTGAVGMSFELERWAFVAMATGTFEWFDSPQNAMPS
jgi:phosphohistidine phosphatase